MVTLTLLAWLVRPVDEMSRIMALHPKVIFNGPSDGTEYDFVSPLPKVVASLPGTKHWVITDNPPWPHWEVALPSGGRATLTQRKYPAVDPPTTCVLIVHKNEEPWFRRAWAYFKSRFGF